MMKSTVFAGRWVAGWLLWSLLTTGCPPPPVARPVWLYSKEHPRFPGYRYLIGIGQATTLTRAEENAVADLRGQLKSLIAGAWNGPPLNPWFDPHGFVPGLPKEAPAPRVALRWSGAGEDKLHAALAVWERSRIALPWIRARDRALQRCREASRASAEGLPEHPYLALQNNLQALAARSQLEAYQAVLLALTRTPADNPELPSLAELAGRVERMLASVRLQVVAGDGQQLTARGKLADPLVVAVRLSAAQEPVPLSDFPVRFRQIGVTIRSGDLGLAATEANSDLRGEGTLVQARPHAETILSDAGIDPADPRFENFPRLLQPAGAVFRLLAPGKKGPRVLVVVRETIGDQVSQEPMLTGELIGALQQAGFDVLTPNDLPEAFRELTDPQRLQAVAGEHARILIRGELRSDLRPLAENFVFSEISGFITVIDLKTGSPIASFEEPVTSAGLDVYSASARAFSRLSRKALPVVLSAIKKRLEAP